MRSTGSIRRRGAAMLAVLTVGLGVAAVPATATPAHRPTVRSQRAASAPYLGWSSWSLQTVKSDSLNPNGDYSWLTEKHVLQQARAMATTLRPAGYRYINIDAGWWRKWDWTPEYDTHGRPAVDTTRFPDGIATVARRVHRMGLKLGIYMPVGLEKGGYDQNPDATVQGAPQCTMRDVVYPDLRLTNGWKSSYKIDFDNGTGCGQAYVNSIVNEFSKWGVDFLKVDGVGPGSNRSTTDPEYNNVDEIAAYHRAIKHTGRPMLLQVSWAVSQDYVKDWQKYSDSWRIDNDIECYCSTLTSWRGVKGRFADEAKWASEAGPKKGFNNLDSLDVGNGAADGLTDDERQTMATLWSISAAPLYTGDDLTKLDAEGVKLLTNRRVLAIDQAGIPAKPISTASDQQVWYARNRDGSYTVALFNLADTASTVGATWDQIGLHRPATVRDVWAHSAVSGAQSGYSTTLAPHASMLLTVRPTPRH